MYTEFDYLTSQILNDVEQRIVDLYNCYSFLFNYKYTPKTWLQNEIVYVDDIKNIEDSIEKIGKDFGYPIGWKTSRKWNLQSNNNINFSDINRWISNIEILFNGNFKPLLPRNDLYPRDGYVYPSNEVYPENNLYSNPLIPTNNVRSD